jgi:7,8-dihydro-6-hydroxymethylpterin dimethyltransferase
MHSPTGSETIIKRTVSRCPICRVSAPAEVSRRSEEKRQTVWLRRRCPEHGVAENCISSDARFYWLAQGDPKNRCCGSVGDGGCEGTLGRNATAVAGAEIGNSTERLSTCLALIEIVNSCNLACPTCYADSPIGASGARLDAVPLADLQQRIQGVIDRKGHIEILQLSGGEPTLHPQFFELVEWVQANPGVDYILINTNGVRIANDRAFAERLGRSFHYGGLQLYLQFDGVQEAGQLALRGVDLRALRERAIVACGEMNLPITLAMTVTHDNLPHVWSTIEFAIGWPNIRGISFQPLFLSGRVQGSGVRSQEAGSPEPINTADVILACVEQSGGTLKFDAFTPLPCGDPNCATIGYLLKTPLGVRSVSDFIDFAEVQGFLRDKVRFSLDDLAQCGCESEPLGRLLHDFELNETSTFRLFIKPFMDAWTWDQDRIDRCCTHVIRPDGVLDSFCRYYGDPAR